MANMKKEEAKRVILGEYDKWAKKHPNDAKMMGGFLFFRYLQQERSDLLDFRVVGDKWQIVHGWIGTLTLTNPPEGCCWVSRAWSEQNRGAVTA
jgi:hypothetical protein